MAITFQDALNHSAPKPEHWLAVPFTLVLTQEDGRTGFAWGIFSVDHQRRRLQAGINNADSAFDVLIVFSDRKRFTGNADRMGIELFKTPNAPGLTMISTLKSWGNAQQTVQLRLQANHAVDGRIYRGLGATIGHGTGKALNVLTLNDIREEKIVLL